MSEVKKSQSFIEEFRILEKELGAQKTDALMNFLTKYNEILMDNLVTKADFHEKISKLEIGFHKDISSLAWKMAILLIGQAAVVVTLMKLLS